MAFYILCQKAEEQAWGKYTYSPPSSQNCAVKFLAWEKPGGVRMPKVQWAGLTMGTHQYTHSVMGSEHGISLATKLMETYHKIRLV